PSAGGRRGRHSVPTRRSSDLGGQAALEQQAYGLEQALHADALAGLARAAHERQHRVHHFMAAPAGFGDHISQTDDLGIVAALTEDRKSTRLNSSHVNTPYAVT